MLQSEEGIFTRLIFTRLKRAVLTSSRNLPGARPPLVCSITAERRAEASPDLLVYACGLKTLGSCASGYEHTNGFADTSVHQTTTPERW